MRVDGLAGHADPKSKRPEKPASGFEALLEDEGSPPPASRDEKKPRPATGTEEALLVSRSLAAHARPAPLIVTKQPELKAPATKLAVAAKAVTVEQLVSRSKTQHEPARLAAPGEKKPTKGELTREPKKGEEAKPTLAPPTITTAAPSTSEPFRIEAPPALRQAAPLAPVAPLILDDPSLRIVLLPTVARMSLDTGEAGRLHVQLKVRDGITELHASGPASQLLEARQGELRVALAKEGLALGQFDLTQSGSGHRHAERPDLERSAPPTARRAEFSPDTAIEDGRVHVKA